MLAACALVNRTSWGAAEGVLSRLRGRWPTPRALAAADAAEVADVVRRLGLHRARSRGLVRLAAAWVARRPRTQCDVLRLPACGPYAADSWAIFVEGRTDVSPTDGKLLWHLSRVRP